MLFAKKNIISITVFLLLMVSVFAFISSNKIEKIDDCVITEYQELVEEFGVCTDYSVIVTCEDEPLNQTCTNISVAKDYTCSKGSKLITKTKSYCKTKSLIIEDKIKINTKDYECSSNEDGDKIILICDSRYDGNGDGVCTSGESCLKYLIQDSNIEEYTRNSQYIFVKNDNSFFLDKPSMEVLK